MSRRLRTIRQQDKVLIEYSDRDEKTIVITLNRPQKLNAMNDDLLDGLHEAIDTLQTKEHVRSVIFASSVERAFSSGIDTSFINGLQSKQDVAQFFYRLQDLFERIMQLNTTTIAAIDGYAFGAGADLALACDIRIANDEVSFRFPGPQFGVVLGTQRLINEIGASKARKLAMMNKRIGAKEALACGIIHEIERDRNSSDRAIEFAEQLRKMPVTTEATIRALCRGEAAVLNEDAREHAKQSILTIDFHETFNRFLQESRK